MVLLIFLQYFELELPHRPLLFESGAPEIPSAFDMDFYYISTGEDTGTTAMIFSRLLMNLGGIHDVWLGFPWIWHKDSLTTGLSGNIFFTYKRGILKDKKWGYLSAGAGVEFPTAKDTLGYRTHRLFISPFISYSYRYSSFSLSLSVIDTFFEYSTEDEKWRVYDKKVFFAGGSGYFLDFVGGFEISNTDLLFYLGIRRGNYSLYISKNRKKGIFLLRLYL